MVSTLNLFASDKPGLSKTESARVTESGCTGASFTGFLPAGKRTRTNDTLVLPEEEGGNRDGCLDRLALTLRYISGTAR